MAMPATLVLHCCTVNGASMLCSLGPLGEAFQVSGFKFVATDGVHAMSYADAQTVVHSVSGAYADEGQFDEGKPRDSDQHFDAADSGADEDPAKKT